MLGPLEINDGNPYKIRAGFDGGAGQLETVSVSRLLVDGEVITGEHTSNRTIVLPITVRAADRSSATAAVEEIVQIVRRDAYTLTWTGDDGSVTVFDCMKGHVEQQWDLNQHKNGVVWLTVTIPALPFVHPPSTSTVGTSVGPTASVQLDAFDNTTALAHNGTVAVQTTGKIEGTGCVMETVANTIDTSATNYATGANGETLYPIYPYTFMFSRALASLDMTGLFTVVSNWYGPGVAYSERAFTLRLTSAGGWREWTGATVQANASNTVYTLPWVQVLFDLLRTPSASSGTFNPAAVTSYTLSGVGGGYSSGNGSATWGVDDLRAYPALAGTITSPSTALALAGVTGIARTPATITVSANQRVTTLLLARAPNPRTGFNPRLTPAGTVFTSAPNAYGGSAVGQLNGLGTYTATYTAAAGTLHGTYLVVTRISLNSATTDTVTVTATVAGSDVTESISRTLVAGVDYTPGPNAYKLQVIGELTLPPTDVPATNYGAAVSIAVSDSGGPGSAGIQHDELYLIDMSGEAFLLSLPLTGTPGFKYFQIVPPDQSGFGSQVFAGMQADGSDWVSVTAYVLGHGAINLNPGTASLLVVLDNPSGNVTSGTLAAEFSPRYFAGAVS
jgi:hypothetical protein